MAYIEFKIGDLRHANPSTLEKDITALGLEAEISGKNVKVDVTADRPELLSFRMLDKIIGMYNGVIKPSIRDYAYGKKTLLEIDARGAPKSRPFINGVCAEGVDLEGNELKYLLDFAEKLSDTFGRKRRKMAIGIHDLDKISGDLIYYSGKEESFVPLGHDKAMSFEEIIKKHQKGVEYSHAVGSDYPVLRDSEKILSFIPITNSKATMVENSTTNLFIDLTGTDESAVRYAAELFGCVLSEMGGKIGRVEVKGNNRISTPSGSWRKVRLDSGMVSETIGIRISSLPKLLSRMGYIASGSGGKIDIAVPPYRSDIFDMSDLIEDVAIAYGYDKIIPSRIENSPYGNADSFYGIYERISKRLIGGGFDEVINHYLTSDEHQFDRTGRKNDGAVRLEYSKNSNFQILRTSLSPLLLSNLGGSANDTMPHRLFECGKVFRLENGRVVERDALCIAISHPKANVSEIKGLIDQVIGMIYGNVSIDRTEDPLFIKGRCGSLIHMSKMVGIFGEVHPKVLRNFKIEEPVVCCEILIR